MAYIIGTDGYKNGILNSDGVLIFSAYYDISDLVKDGQTLRFDVPIQANDFLDVNSTTYAKWDGENWLEIQNSIIISINFNWKTNYNDYKTARVAMYAAMMTVGGFNNLSIEEKKIVSAWFIVGSNERDSVHTFAEQKANGIIFNENSSIARRSRLTAAKMEVYNRLAHDEVNAILTRMDPSKLMYNYVNLGTEGTLEGDMEGICDYILSRAGTSYENVGLVNHEFVPVGMTNMQDLANRLIDILKNGNY